MMGEMPTVLPGRPAPSPGTMVRFQGIGKSFFGVPVLREVSFEAERGRILGLVGENGAGKSTLMNILGGSQRPDAGRMELDGSPYSPREPADAARSGVAFIHQELNLFPNLSIAENLFIAAFPPPRPPGLIHRRSLRAAAARLLGQVGFEVDPDTPVERLSAGERQMVEVAKALGTTAKVIIFDEPTTSLSAPEVERLFELMGGLRARGITPIYISHNLGDVLRLADDVVVLRDGEVVGRGRKEEFTAGRMISLMVGRSISRLYPARESRPTAEPLLEVRGVSRRGIVRDITFTVHRGEVLGISGLLGAGRSELARILFGADPLDGGRIDLEGSPVEGLPPAGRISRGMAFLTEDRRAEGLCMEGSIAENIALVSLAEFVRTPLRLVEGRRLGGAVAGIREAVRLGGAGGDRRPVRTLSGGNQQKVVLAKWLLARPGLLILDEPTRGIDVGAKLEVYRLVCGLADRGAGILLISSEIEELIGLCDRILVMRRGEITDRLERDQFDRERLLRSSIEGGTEP